MVCVSDVVIIILVFFLKTILFCDQYRFHIEFICRPTCENMKNCSPNWNGAIIVHPWPTGATKDGFWILGYILAQDLELRKYSGSRNVHRECTDCHGEKAFQQGIACASNSTTHNQCWIWWTRFNKWYQLVDNIQYKYSSWVAQNNLFDGFNVPQIMNWQNGHSSFIKTISRLAIESFTHYGSRKQKGLHRSILLGDPWGIPEVHNLLQDSCDESIGWSLEWGEMFHISRDDVLIELS